MDQPIPVKRPPKGKKPLHRLSFHGTGGALFGMWIVNAFLTMCTLGIYSFWAKAKVRRYLYSQLEFRKERFVYHGTGKEAFLGAIKVVGLYVCVVLGAVVLTMLGIPGMDVLASLLIGALNLALFPIAMVGARKYRLSRTSLHGIRFSFRGNVKDFLKIFVPGALLTGLTLGIYFPFLRANMQRYLLDHSYYGNRPFQYHGQGKDLIKDYVVAVLLTPFTLGVIWMWTKAKIARYDAQHTTFGKARFRSGMTGWALYKHNLINMLLIMFTLGWAFPWVMTRNMRFTCTHLQLVGELDMQAIKQEAQLASATGEEMADLLDLDIGVGF